MILPVELRHKNKLWTEKSKEGRKEKKRAKPNETQSNENENSLKKNKLKAKLCKRSNKKL